MFGIRAMMRFKTTNAKKDDLGKLFKKMNRDTKQMFGNLLETNKIRKKRLKSIIENRENDVKRNNDYLDRCTSKIKPIEKGNINIIRRVFVLFKLVLFFGSIIFSLKYIK